MDFKKHQDVITWGNQANSTSFLKKVFPENKDYNKKRHKQTLLKNPNLQEYSRLFSSATREWLATVQYNNLRMQLFTRDCSVEQPANGYKNFLKRKEKTLILSNAEVSKSEDKKPQTNSQANWSG